MAERVLVAKFAHESNTFAAGETTVEDVRASEEYYGEEIPAYFEDTGTEIAGAMDAAATEGLELVYTVAAQAEPGAPLTADAYDYYTDEILAAAEEHDDVDGVLLVLHGAMVAANESDGEGALVERVRAAVGETPIAVTHDLHGNVTERLVENADALIAYETHPHVDKFETGQAATHVLRRAIDGDPVDTVAEFPPVLPHSPFQNTNTGPMAEVQARARDLEDRAGVLKVSVLPGFHRADVPGMGFSVPVVGSDPEAARGAARDLAGIVWERREEFVGDYPTPEAAVAEAKRLVEAGETDDGPVVMADFGPQPGGGGAADGTPTLRALLEAGVTNAGYAIMRDPEAVAACVDAGVGERVAPTVGGKTDDRHGDPIEDLAGYVKAITDGTYVNAGDSHQGKGVEKRMGRTIRFQCGREDGVTVVLCEQRAPPFDREVWRHVGVPPERLDVIVVTSTAAFRADYEPIASHVIEVDSPGVASPLPERFDYEHVRRPQFPIDEMPDDAYPDW
jgi:microcystin degradation protein MlrC